MLTISPYNCKFNDYSPITPAPKTMPAFGMDADYASFMVDSSSVKNISSYFRRGLGHGEPNKGFKDIADVFVDYYKNNSRPMDLLIAGVANAQEPFSYLTTIQAINPDKPLKKLVDLNCIDLKSRISSNDLVKYAKCPYAPPKYAKSCFDFDGKEYKVKHKIIKYLGKVFENPEKSRWNTYLEEFSKDLKPNTYDIISANNILYYLDDNDEELTVENLHKSLKPGGIMITDIKYYQYFRDYDDMQEIKPGIYKKSGRLKKFFNTICSSFKS